MPEGLVPGEKDIVKYFTGKKKFLVEELEAYQIYEWSKNIKSKIITPLTLI